MIRTLLRFTICALNWETLGQPCVAPAKAKVGSPCSPVQSGHVQRLERLIIEFARLARGAGCELGRALEKFSHLGEALTFLAHQLGNISEKLSPYGDNKLRSHIPVCQ